MAEQSRDAPDSVAHLDDEQSRDLVAFVNGRSHDGYRVLNVPAWREVVNGRWVVFLKKGEQTYCLMPLAFSRPEGVP